MVKPLMAIRAPVGTRSGYGDMSRDIVRHLIELDKWDIKILSCPWGQTPMNALSVDNPKDKPIIDRLMLNPGLPRQPEIFVSITVPNEFKPIGKYNIGITAGIETTACAPEWLQGMNQMDLILTISEHSKKVLLATKYDEKDQQGNLQGNLALTKPIEVLHNCVDTSIFYKIPSSKIEPAVNDVLKDVKEKFCFLFVGHWLGGAIGEDRKDVGMLIKTFLETFRRVPKAKRPALILKTSGASFSVLDREEMLKRIAQVKSTFTAKSLPSVYLLHGEFTEPEMNSLYNHPKIKVNVTFTKGEGFGRPLLEASLSGKPIIASGWSGHMDFLNAEEAILLGGELVDVGQSAVWEGVINAGTKWFQVDYNNASGVLNHVWKHYNLFSHRGDKLIKKNSEAFAYDKIRDDIDKLMTKYLPEFKIVEEMNLSLPTLPTLKKISVGKKAPGIKKVAVKKKKAKKIEKATLDAPVGATAVVAVGAKAATHNPEAPAGEIAHTGEEVNAR